MSMKKTAFLLVAVLSFATLMLYMLTGHDRVATPSRTETAREAIVFSGKLDIRAMDDLRVGGRKVLLCGVAFTRPRSLEPIVRDQARRAYQGQQLDCIQVGGGTPCDGRASPVFGGAVVAQCRTAQGADLAHQLSSDGYLCDLPAQSGSIYKGC